MAEDTENRTEASSEPREFAVTVTDGGDETVVAIQGEVDLYTAPRLREQLEGAVATDSPNVVIDLDTLDFIDSTGLGVLVGALKEAENRGGEVRLRNPGRSTRKILEIAGLTEVFTIE